jgi:hypothetical protein
MPASWSITEATHGRITSYPMSLMSPPGLNFDLSTPATLEWDPQSEIIHDEQSYLTETHLPSHDLLIELVDLFFEHLYHMFPCFHRTTFKEQVGLGTTQEQSPLVLFAICCVTARLHPDTTVRQREKEWYEQAKFSYQLTQRYPYPGLRTLQAALLIIEYACTAGDFSSAWLFLGKAWRQAIALGMNRMDAGGAASTSIESRNTNDKSGSVDGLEANKAATAVEREEQRRIMWLLFIIDRNHAWPTAWPNSILETHFKVDMPTADALFQKMGAATYSSPCDKIPFTRNLGSLITSSNSTKDPINVLHYVCIAHVLLGRVAEKVQSLHDAPDTPEYAEECEELDSYIIKFRLSIPRQAASLFEAQPADRGLVLWLQVMMNTSTILLNYRCSKDVPVADASSRFIVAVAAARNTAQLVRDASRISIDLLISPHIASSLYVAALLLVIEWRTTGDPKLKDEIDLFALVFVRINEAFVYLGLKFSYALEHDLERSQGENLEELKDRGLRGLLADCSKWTHIKEKIVRDGIHIDIT